MIRLTFLLRRRPELSLEDFQRTWLEDHGPLVASHSTNLRIVRYVQVHTLDDPANQQMAEARGGMEPPYDGVAELWWASREELAAPTEAGARAGMELLEDERRFIDLKRSPLWLAHEYPQVNPAPEGLVARTSSPIVKLFYCLRHAEAWSLGEAQRTWHADHGPLIRSLAQAMGVLRYVQVHRVEDEVESALRAARATTVPSYTGHAELWFDRAQLAAAASTSEAAAAGERAIEDERRFIDFARSAMWLAKEHVLVDRG